MYYLAVFNSRTDVYSFASLLKAYKINAAIVDLPANLRRSCGLAVRIPNFNITEVRQILARHPYRSFVNIYAIG